MNGTCVKLLELKGKVDTEEFQECVKSCERVFKMNNIKYCADVKCRANKKRLHTRKKKIKDRAEWLSIENKLYNSKKKLYDSVVLPYLILEATIGKSYDSDIKEYLSKKLRVKEKELKKQGINNLYELKVEEVKRIVEVVILKSMGLERADYIIKNKLS